MTVRSRERVLEDNPDVVVDLSNVCCDGSLGSAAYEAEWTRYERVLAAWRAQMDEHPRAAAIADASLRYKFSPEDCARFKREVSDGAVKVVHGGEADPEILRLAERTHALVLSDDLFRDHRRFYPWIEAEPSRFYTWKTHLDGEIRIVAQDMCATSPRSISIHEEAKLLRNHDLDPDRSSQRVLLQHAYRCDNPECLNGSAYRDGLPYPPRRGPGGEPLCRHCKSRLVDLGSMPDALKLVFEHDGEKLWEFLIEDAHTLELGRTLLTKQLGPESASVLELISRRHLELRWADGRLLARDLGSQNGTTIARRRHGSRSLGTPEPLVQDELVEVGPADELVIADAIVLRRSGKDFTARTDVLPPARATDAPQAGAEQSVSTITPRPR
jgi:hypothetical protein